MPRKIDLPLITRTLRKRDALIAHRKRCKKLVNCCAKCARLNLHERAADLRYAAQHARDAGLNATQMFEVMLGVMSGGY
jgi:hypothetical protein